MSPERLHILQLVLMANETSAGYNEHCLPLAGRHRVALASFFPSAVTPPPQLDLYQGDGSLGGFLNALDRALRAGPYDVIHAHAPQFWPLLVAASLRRRRPTRRLLFTLHGAYTTRSLRDRLLWLSLLPFARRVVPCGEASLQSFPGWVRRLARGRLSPVPNGVDLARLDRAIAARTPRDPARGFTVMQVARLVDIKNPRTTLEAFLRAAEPESRLVFLGEGPLRAALESRCRDLPGQVELPGLVPREEAFRRLCGADLFVSPSRGEGLPVAVLEAMACGVPVLLSDIPPHREIAQATPGIPLVDPDDVAGFAREIERFREMSAEARRALGKRCREAVESRYTLAAMHRAYERIYAEIRSP